MKHHSITDMLTEIPTLAYEAHATWGTRPVTHDTASRRPVPGSRCLADLDRMLALSGANDVDGLGVLSGWVRMIVEEHDEAGEPIDWPADTIPAACTWLTGQLRWSVGRGYESEMHDDIRRLWSTLRAVCGVRDATPWPCLTDGCQGSMRLIDGMLTCEHGHRHAGLARWRFHPSMLIADAAAALNAPERSVRRWASMGTIARDEAKGLPVHVWPWDVLRMRYPDLVEAIEHEGAA